MKTLKVMRRIQCVYTVLVLFILIAITFTSCTGVRGVHNNCISERHEVFVLSSEIPIHYDTLPCYWKNEKYLKAKEASWKARLSTDSLFLHDMKIDTDSSYWGGLKIQTTPYYGVNAIGTPFFKTRTFGIEELKSKHDLYMKLSCRCAPDYPSFNDFIKWLEENGE